MQTPYPPPIDRLHGIRVGMALLLTGSTVMLAVSVVLRLYAIGQANEQLQIEQQEQAVLQRLQSLKADKNYLACQQAAAQVPAASKIHYQALTLGDECQQAQVAAIFQESQRLAQAGLLPAAIAKVQTITDHSATLQVQQWVLTWSNQILQTAEAYYQDSSDDRLQDAIQTAATIPPSSVLYSQAQAKIRQWQADWATNQSHWQTAQAAQMARQPRVVLAQIQQLTHPYWRQQAMPLLQSAYAALPNSNFEQTSETPSSPEASILTTYAQLLLPVSLGLLIARLSLGQSSSE